MIARHGFESAELGRRTLSFLSGGRRMGASFVEAPFGGMVNTWLGRGSGYVGVQLRWNCRREKLAL